MCTRDDVMDVGDGSFAYERPALGASLCPSFGIFQRFSSFTVT